MKSGHSVIVRGLSTRREDIHQSRSVSGLSERNCRAPSNVPPRTRTRPPKTAIALPPRARADRAESRERREGRQERRDQVVGVLGGDAGRAGGQGEEIGPEVVVGEPLAGEPRIREREAHGRHEARQDGEVHGLFRLANLAEGPAEPQEEEKDAEEDDERKEARAGAGEDSRKVRAAPEERARTARGTRAAARGG